MTSNKISQYNTLILFNLFELQLLLPFAYDNFESLLQNFRLVQNLEIFDLGMAKVKKSQYRCCRLCSKILSFKQRM